MKREKQTTKKIEDIEPYVATRPMRIPVHAFDLQGHYIKTFESQYEAEKELKVRCSGISLCLRGKSKRAGNYQFRKAE